MFHSEEFKNIHAEMLNHDKFKGFLEKMEAAFVEPTVPEVNKTVALLGAPKQATHLSISGSKITAHLSPFRLRLYFTHEACGLLSGLPSDDIKDNVRDWLSEMEDDGGEGLAGALISFTLLYIVLVVDAMVSTDRDSGGHGANLFSYGPLPGGTPFVPADPWPSDYGPLISGPFDTMAHLPNGYFYATRGGSYIKYGSNGTADGDFPKPIRGNWGDLPESFMEGFDTMATLRNGDVYVTKGGLYVKYTDHNATHVSSGYPRPIRGNWGNLPESFNEGFDSMTVLPDGYLHITKGDKWVFYTDDDATSVAGGPTPIRGSWGNIPESFNGGFDSMATLNNGKTYIFKGTQYVRYSDLSASTVDPGYPKDIAGNWGRASSPF